MARDRSPLIIDIEASGFGVSSYPIEVGVALRDGSTFCSLITPAADWTHWDSTAEAVHRVSRDILRSYGKPLREVTAQLNALLDGCTLYTDGWVVDRPWLTTLFYAAHTPMMFSVSPLELILSEAQMALWHETKNAVTAGVDNPRHRASYDAWVIQETYRRTFDARQED